MRHNVNMCHEAAWCFGIRNQVVGRKWRGRVRRWLSHSKLRERHVISELKNTQAAARRHNGFEFVGRKTRKGSVRWSIGETLVKARFVGRQGVIICGSIGDRLVKSGVIVDKIASGSLWLIRGEDRKSGPIVGSARCIV